MDYVAIDNDLETAEVPDDASIVQSVLKTNEDECDEEDSEEESSTKILTPTDALIYMKAVSRFMQHQTGEENDKCDQLERIIEKCIFYQKNNLKSLTFLV